MILRKVLLATLTATLSLVTYANALDHGPNAPSKYLISFSVGPAWTHAGQSQTISLEPDVIKRYVADNLTNTDLMINAEIFFGLQKYFYQHIQTQFGLAVYASSFATLRGYIQEDADPNFQNYAYSYDIDHEHIALKTKWVFENELNLNPYLSLSIGVGFNYAHGFSITPLISQEIAAPPFRSHTEVAFSYSFGVGFQREFDCHYAIGLGYELVSWGKSSLNKAEGQTSGNGLHLSNLYTQGIALNLSYVH